MRPTISLRARKQAETRRALLGALLARLDGTRGLEAVHVRELCDEAGISEASFFNYFPKKTDLLFFFVRVWSLDLSWRVRHELAQASAREAITEIFVRTARELRAHPGVMPEIIAFQARMTEPPAGALDLADRVAAFPERDGIEDVPALGLDSLLPELLERAVARGELPASVDRAAAFLALTSVFFGVPLALGPRNPELVEAAYVQQLAVVWAGLSSRPPAPPKPRASARKGRAR